MKLTVVSYHQRFVETMPSSAPTPVCNDGRINRQDGDTKNGENQIQYFRKDFMLW